MIEDTGAILRSVVTELGIRGQWVNVVPEDVQELGVANFRRIVDDLDGLSVASPTGGHFLIGGMFSMTSRIAGRGGNHAFELIERRFHAPETATRKRCLGQ